MSAEQTLPPPMFDLDPAEVVERKRSPRPRAEQTLPPPMFDPGASCWEHVVRLHVIHSTDVDRRYFCGDDSYGYLDGVPAGHDAWVWHCCTQRTGHDGEHRCDRCEQTWVGAPTHHLSAMAAAMNGAD